MVSTCLLEIRLETPPGQSWPGLATLTQTWNRELEAQRFGRLLQVARKQQPGCATEADVLTFELHGDLEVLIPLVRERLRQFLVPPSTVVSFQETSRDGQPLGPHGPYRVLPVADEPALHPWGGAEQAMMSVILTELHQEPRWQPLCRRLEALLPRFQLLGLGCIDLDTLTTDEAAAFLVAADRSCKNKANEGPVGWAKPEMFPDWLHRFRLHLERWTRQVRANS